MTTDLVCEMPVDPQKTEHKSLYQGKTYYFCSAACKDLFDHNPKKYIEASSEPQSKG